MSQSMTCTTDIRKAEKVKLSWSSKYNGLCFWNQSNYELNNLEGYNSMYNWWSTKDNFEGDPNSTFLVSIRFSSITFNNIRYRV